MADEHETEEPDVMPEFPRADRSTAPQSEYTMREVGIGVAVLAVGLLLTFGLGLGLGF